MTVQLDHLLVPSHDKIAAAQQLAGLLGVPWSATGIGPFAPVYVNDGLTLDFDQWEMLTLSYARARSLCGGTRLSMDALRPRGVARRPAAPPAGPLPPPRPRK